MANVGDMRNTGIELSLNADAIRTKDFDWNISLNLAHNENEVTRLSNDVFTMDKILLGDVFIRGGSSSGTHVLKKDALSDNSTVWFVTVLTRTVDISW